MADARKEIEDYVDWQKLEMARSMFQETQHVIGQAMNECLAQNPFKKCICGFHEPLDNPTQESPSEP